MADYIPSTDPEKIAWLGNFSTWLQANGAAHGFTPAEIADFVTATATAVTAYSNNVTAQDAAKAATAAKKTALTGAIALARDDAQRLQYDPNMTDEERAAAGLTVRDTTPTAGGADQIMTIPPPLLLLDFSVRRQVTIHWGPNPSNERQNARPEGVIGCQIQTAVGGIPTDEALWVTLDTDRDSPLIHTIPETTPTTYAFRARYVGKNLKLGPFGDPATCTISA